ncbi:hypothetical protein L1049_003706 [Liquidambar formosana]|uniref:Uncharacterized protein n=1 Tax=Liquidambar formosana TaxID=63359 RepID=A0AAP0RQK8_LIQFO
MRESLGSFRNLHQYPLVPTSMDSRCQMNMYVDMTSISPPSSNSFFTQEAMRVGMIRNDSWRNDRVRDAPTVRTHYQFELDREQMWERIIAEESFRKQELEAEVRRQILMERELALQRPAGFPLIAPSSASLVHYPCNCNRRSDENSSSFGSVEYGALNRMPFQRHPDTLMPEVQVKSPSWNRTVIGSA